MFTNLVDAAEADSVLSRLYDSQPDLFYADSPAECHSRIERHLEIARACGIQAASASYHFGALALILADGFVRFPAMANCCSERGTVRIIVVKLLRFRMSSGRRNGSVAFRPVSMKTYLRKKK